jgi:hypothetical protein
MRHATPAIALLCCLPGLAAAGEIYGKISSATAPVGEGIEVSAKCGANGYPPVTTDKTGNYHLVVAESGKCALTITQKGTSATVDVVSYDEGTQADIVLEAKDGKLAARRR